MVQIKLKGETTPLDCIDVYGFKKNVQGAHRDVFEFHFATEGNVFDDLNTLFNDEAKTEEITIIEGEGENQQEFLHKNFNLHLSTEVRKVELSPETSESPAVHENRYVVTLGQLTYTEKKIKQQEQDISQLYFLVAMGGTV